MRKLFLPLVACTLWLLMFTGSAAAADTPYQVSFPVDGGSVTGTITTDGFLGPLFTVDISSFDLTLTDGSGTADLSSAAGGGVFIGSGGLVAVDDTTLEFNFNTPMAFLNFFNTTTCQPVLAFRTTGGTVCNGFAGSNQVQIDVTGTSPSTAAAPAGGLFSFEQEIPPTPAPEPASLGMIVVGLVSMIGLRKLRF